MTDLRITSERCAVDHKTGWLSSLCLSQAS